MRRQRSRLWWALPLLLAVALAGCGEDGGGDGIATAGEQAAGADPDTGDAPSELTEQERYEAQLAFVECMREHGVDLPDPEPGEGLRLQVRGDPAEIEAAMAECRQLLPDGGQGLGGGDPEQQERMLAFAECMRENGVPNFPDPQEGGIRISPEDGVDPEDPTFQAAEETCRQQLGLDAPAETSGGRG